MKISSEIKRFSKVAVISTVTACAALAVTATGSVNVKAADYKLVWSDEFNGTELNRDNWNVLEGNGGKNPGWGNNELEYYKDSKDNLFVKNGALNIVAREEQTHSDNEYFWNSLGQLQQVSKDFYYTSARLTTSGKQSFQYGKIEARMKLPAVKGIWPAFWMMGYNDKGWPYCGEIDILEAWNEAQFAQGAWHWYDDEKPNKETWNMYLAKQMTSTSLMRDYDNNYVYDANGKFVKPWAGFDKTQWHTYGIIWDKKAIRFTVDDKIYWVVDTTSASMSEAQAPYYFLLNMAVGGNLPGTGPDAGVLPVTTYVDYVRVYQRTDDVGSKYVNTWKEQNAVKKYTVKITDGSKVYYNTTKYDGESINLPTTLTKKGYIYKGIYTTDGKRLAAGESRVRSNITATVRWEKVKVAKASISKLTAKKKSAVIKLKSTGAKGFEVKYGTKKSLKGARTTSFEGSSSSIRKLKSKKKYYFKARAYKLDSVKGKVYGKWSSVKSVKIK